VSDPTDLFDPRLAARRTDVDTSHDAADSMEFQAGKQHLAILDVLEDYRRPMAPEEIEDALGYSIWRRMNELERGGLIEREEKPTYVNRSNRKAYRYTLKA
jgi:DNA-binding HxlR family transcriptional regulator